MTPVRGFLCTSDPCSTLRNDRKRRVVVVRSPALIVSELGGFPPGILPSEYGPVYVISALGAHGQNRWWSSRYAAGGMELRYALMSMECPCPPLVGEGLLGVKYSLGGCRIRELWSWMFSLIDGRVPLLLRRNHSTWKPEVGTRRRDPNPGEGTWNLEPGTWRNSMIFFIGLHVLHRSIRLLVEFGIGRRLVAGAIKLPCQYCSDVLMLDETFLPWWGLVGIRRKFDGEAGNVCVKGDASAHAADACAAPECMGQNPKIMRGRMLASLRISEMRRSNRTRRPKPRVFMLDSGGLACAS
ncbi:hypothetical protein DY000_02031510 [Brassica cretica]|uniref:Uncharacterized protein n=1 Tax=Brassica cretica TaxID=69181 RepID=A0ABQ7DQ97_BRACR|nr:hypothetical protein DY000_02031510 [Brassica cretica]